MPLQATRAIGTGDGWDVTHSGIYIPDWAELEDVRPGSIIEAYSQDKAKGASGPAERPRGPLLVDGQQIGPLLGLLSPAAK